MKKTIICATAASMALIACGSKTDANDKNFSAALTQYFDKKGALCLGENRWPVDLSEMDVKLRNSAPFTKAARMSALEAAGLAKSADVEVEGKGFDGKPNGLKFKVKRYELTDQAKPFAQSSEVSRFGGAKETQTDLCWGKKALDKIVKWEGPMKLGDYQEAKVRFHYRIDALAEWAKRADIQTAYPAVKTVIDSAGNKEEAHGVKLTSDGWEALGLGN